MPSAAIQQGYRVLYRKTDALLDELADAALDGKRKEHMEFLSSVPLLILDDLGMRRLPPTAAEEVPMRPQVQLGAGSVLHTLSSTSVAIHATFSRLLPGPLR